MLFEVVLTRLNTFGVVTGTHPKDVFMPFDLSMMNSMLEGKKKVKIIDNDVLEWNCLKWETAIKRFNPKFLIIKFNPEVARELEVAIRNIKKHNKKIKVILLDFYINDWYKKILVDSKADAAIWGDAEEVVAKYILDGVEGDGFVKVNKRGELNKSTPAVIKDIGILPFYSHDKFLSNKYKIVSKSVNVLGKIKWGFILTSRGCPYKCDFCSPNIRNSFGTMYRSMTADRLIRELDYMVNELGINAISFEDDLFTLNKPRTKEICNLILNKKLKFSWVVSTRADCLDEELVKLMKRAGCGGMAIGVESGSEDILKQMDKGESVETIRKVLMWLHKYGIALTTNIILGYPGETEADYLKTRDLLREVKPLFVHGHYLTLYPGSKIYKYYKNLLKESDIEFDHRKYNHLNLTKINDTDFRNLIGRLYWDYYFSYDYLWTYLKFRWQYWIFNPISEVNFLGKTAKYLVAKIK